MSDFDSIRDASKKLVKATEDVAGLANVLKEVKVEFKKQIENLIEKIREIEDESADAALDLVRGALEQSEKEFDRFAEDMRTQASRLTSIAERLDSLVPRESEPVSVEVRSPPLIVNCRQWDDFATLAHEAQRLSFLYNETSKTFEAYALKNSHLMVYRAEFPERVSLLKVWLSKKLNIPQERILEGSLNL